MEQAAATVFSVYMPNISLEMIRLQRLCVEKFLPASWAFVQYLHETDMDHVHALQQCLQQSSTDTIVFLDIDCIPLASEGFAAMKAGVDQGRLVGAAQRANHLHNDQHVYVAPSCMALSRTQYEELGSPSFYESWRIYDDEDLKWRSDVAEELTYRWEEQGAGVELFWPTHSETLDWDLRDGKRYGLGTTYADCFYHAFSSPGGDREEAGEHEINEGYERFRRKCEAVLGSATPVGG